MPLADFLANFQIFRFQNVPIKQTETLLDHARTRHEGRLGNASAMSSKTE